MERNTIRARSHLLLLSILLSVPQYAVGKRQTLRRKNPVATALDQAEDPAFELPAESEARTTTGGTPLITAPASELLLDTPSSMPTPPKEEVVPAPAPETKESPLAVIEQKLKKEEEKIEFHFEDADLATLVKQIEEIFSVTFISDESLNPNKGTKPIRGNKVSFKSHKALSQQEAFNLFLTFLNMAGVTIVSTSDEWKLSIEHPLPKAGSIFRIQQIETARKSPIRAEIGTDPEKLPDSDEIIRYVYFLENSTVEAVEKIINSLRSSASDLTILHEHKAFMLTDRAYNIKTLMRIIKELDQISVPESMSILKLKQADAREVKELYQSIIREDDRSGRPSFLPRKGGSSSLFPEDTKIIAEPRTNSLILLGSRTAIQKIEEFVKTHVDKELERPESPLRTHRLKFADATEVASIMNDISKFGEGTPAAQSGGVRGQDKYLKSNMVFVAEKSTNSLIIRGDQASYLMAKEAIDKLDEAQPQVAIEALILSVNVDNNKELGTQLRSKQGGHDGLTGKNVKFQTSGMFRGQTASAIKENPNASTGIQRLLSNLIDLVVGAPAGNTIITLGQDICGVWGIFQLLQTVSNTQVISNPFVVANNKAKSTVSLGEGRRVKSGQVGEGDFQSFDDESAALSINVTPQINSEGLILLDLEINIDEFANQQDEESARKFVKKIKTRVIVNDKEVLALGGLIRNKTQSDLNKTPLLGDIPLLGWLFKNRRKQLSNENLLILISTRIVKPGEVTDAGAFTRDRIATYQGVLDDMPDHAERHDPISRVFFDTPSKTENVAANFIFERGKRGHKRRGRRRGKKDQDASEQLMDTAPQTPEQAPPNQTAHLLAQSKRTTQSTPTTQVAQLRKQRGTRPALGTMLDAQSEVQA